MKSYAFKGLAGCVVQRTARSTGTKVGLYNARQAHLDDTLPWCAVCEDHGSIVATETLALARSSLSQPEEWCEVCRSGFRLNGRLVDLDDFLWDNRHGIGEEEARKIRSLKPGESYTGGGGATPTWEVSR